MGELLIAEGFMVFNFFYRGLMVRK